MTNLIDNVSDTAFWIAHYRGKETARPDALIHDPLAAQLAGERGRKIAESMPHPRMTEWMTVVRTIIIDNYIARAVQEGTDVVLNLGAGLDTRPYRLNLPASLRWIEVDFPHVIEFKERELGNEVPRVQLERIKLDLTQRHARQELLARVNVSAKKVLVLTEGVVPYLSVEEVAPLADDLKANEHFAGWIVDYISPRAFGRSGSTALRRRMKNAPFKFAPSDWFEFFQTHGWRVREIRYLAEEGRRIGRRVPLPFVYLLFIALRRLFSSKEALQKSSRFAGYALLERN